MTSVNKKANKRTDKSMRTMTHLGRYPKLSKFSFKFSLEKINCLIAEKSKLEFKIALIKN
jgi:hypothetical protein